MLILAHPCSRSQQAPRCNHKTGRIDLKADNANLLQIGLQGVEFTKDPELLAALGGEGAFGEAVAQAARLANGNHDTDSAGNHQLDEGRMVIFWCHLCFSQETGMEQRMKHHHNNCTNTQYCITLNEWILTNSAVLVHQVNIFAALSRLHALRSQFAQTISQNEGNNPPTAETGGPP